MKQFLISKNLRNRIDYVREIEGKKIAIYSETSDLLKEFDLCIDMNRLMTDDYFLENIVKCDATTTLVLIDILVKNGIYVHPFGKIFRFTEVAKQTLMIDTFAFKWDEKNIVRPFLFIDTSVFGTSMIGFHADEGNTVENYAERIAPYIEIDVQPIETEVINYTPSAEEIDGYNALKKRLIMDEKQPKNKVITALIKYIDVLPSKQKSFIKCAKDSAVAMISNKPKNKFWLYDVLKNEYINKIYFFSSGVFGADEIELSKTKTAIERHNKLIELLKEYEKIQPK